MIQTETIKEEMVTKNLQPGQARDLIIENRGNPDFIALDVCTKGEFDQRHLDDAVNISFLSRSFKTEIRQLDKDKTYLVYCTVGARSMMAMKSMKKAGFKRVFNLVGGTLLWEDYEYPFAKGADTVTGFTVCPVTNSQLMMKRMKAFFKKMGLSSVPDVNCSPDKPAQPAPDFGDVCRCSDTMPGLMSGCCADRLDGKKEPKVKQGG